MPMVCRAWPNATGCRTRQGVRVCLVLGHTKIYTFSESGKTLTTTDSVGRTTTMVYDGQERLVSQTAAEGDNTAYEYDANHNVTKVTQNPKTGCTGSCTPLVNQSVYERVTATSPAPFNRSRGHRLAESSKRIPARFKSGRPIPSTLTP